MGCHLPVPVIDIDSVFATYPDVAGRVSLRTSEGLAVKVGRKVANASVQGIIDEADVVIAEKDQSFPCHSGENQRSAYLVEVVGKADVPCLAGVVSQKALPSAYPYYAVLVYYCVLERTGAVLS